MHMHVDTYANISIYIYMLAYVIWIFWHVYL